MTARQAARVRTRSDQAETWSYESQRAPHVGEVLKTARERKGVDLARAERETKIRARHLAALEAGDFDDLPAAVYTKGFLRNYSTYLGLDAEEMLSRWRREIDQPRTADPVKVIAPPQPIMAPNRGFKLTSGLIIALVLAAVVSGFLGYVGLQLIRFTQNPEISLRGPSQRILPPGSDRVLIVGGAAAGAEITATGADALVRTATADRSGTWNLNMPVDTGRNDFTIFATDAETGRDSEPINVIATVQVGTITTPGVSDPVVLPETATEGGEPSAAVAMTSPSRGFKAKNGKIRVAGTTDAESVIVSFQWRGKPENKRKAPAPITLPVVDGIYSTKVQLPRGQWQVGVSAEIGGGAPGVATTNVRSVYEESVVRIEAVDGGTRVNVSTSSGDSLISGLQLEPGESKTIKSSEDLVVRVGNAKAAHLSVDGVEYGRMGRKAESRSWRVDEGQKAKPIR